MLLWHVVLFFVFMSMDVQHTMATKSSSMFKFGIIADVQYAKIPNALNFQCTRVRRYRESLDILKKAVAHWNFASPKLLFSIVLGDMIDNEAARLNMQHYCLDNLLAVCGQSAAPLFACFGNHCFATFSRQELFDKLCPSIPADPEVKRQCRPDRLYYDWSPYPGWRFVALDGYDVSLMGASSEEHRVLAEQLLARHNPNDLRRAETWFDNLPRKLHRWMPYSGAVGAEQLQWFKGVLRKSRGAGERVVVFLHQPVHSPDKPTALLWNCEEVLGVACKYGNVCLWLAGHDHDGQYSVDRCGAHHLVPPAPIECASGQTAFGTITVHADRLVLNWQGVQPTHTVVPWPSELLLSTPDPL